MAARKSPYEKLVLQRNHLRSLGVNLWADAVPEAIRQQFWTQAERIRSRTRNCFSGKAVESLRAAASSGLP